MIDPDDEIVDAELVDDTPAAIELLSNEEVAQRTGLANLRRRLLSLDDQRIALVAAQDADGLAYGSAAIRDIITDLSALKRNVDADLAKLLLACHEAAGLSPRRNPKHFVEGLGEVSVPGGNERTNWQSEEILKLLVKRTFFDHETGEKKDLGTQEGAVAEFVDILKSCLSFGASTAWKVGTFDNATKSYVGGLRGVGIEPEDYCTEQAKQRLAVIPKRPAS